MPKKQIHRRFLNTISIVMVVTAILYSVTNFYLDKKISNYLCTRVNKASDKQYTLLIGGITANFFDMSLEFKNVKLVPIQLFNGDRAAKYNVSASKIKLKALDILTYFSNKTLFADELRFENLAISIFKYNLPASAHKVLTLKDTLSIYHLVASKFDRIKIDHVNINSAKVKIYNAPVYYSEVFSSEESDLKINNLMITKDGHQPESLLFDDLFNVRFKDISYKLENNYKKNRFTDKGSLHYLYSNSIANDSLRVFTNYKKSIF